MSIYTDITVGQLANAFRATLPPGLPHGEGTNWGKLCDALAEVVDGRISEVLDG